MLVEKEIERYQKQINLFDVGLSGQQRLKEARVLCVGLGGLGSPLCLYLAACGVGHLGLVDADQVDITNLHRQILYRTEDCGKNKATLAERYLQQINPYCNLTVYDEFLTEKNSLSIVSSYDIVADCSDNFSTRYLINDACLKLDKINVMAAVNCFQGQLAIFPGKLGPCYRCLFENAEQTIFPNCNEAGVLGTVPGILGSFQAHEIMKLIIGIGKPMVGKMILFDLLNFSIKQFEIGKNRGCLCCDKNFIR